MTLRYVMTLGLGLAVAGLPAFAFQEEAGPAATQGAEATQAAPETAPAAGLAVTPKDKAAEGTEVTIPGFGTLGVLPKMDFGLELLYGANEEKAPGPENSEAPEDSDLAIRGSVKHKF